jgi:hypothetical protein
MAREEIMVRQKLIINTDSMPIKYIRATPKKGAVTPLRPIRVKSTPW